MAVVLATLVTEWTETALINVLGFALLATIAATGIAFAYRRYGTRRLPIGVSALAGLAAVGLPLNVAATRGTAVIVGTDPFHHATAVYVLGAAFAGTVAAEGGRRIGDHLACEVYGIEPIPDTVEAAAVLRSARLSGPIHLPETIADADGYPVVNRETKRTLEGRTMLFPHALSIDDLESRLIDRLERDYGIGHASVDLARDGTVERLAIGGRRRGSSRTLPPDTAAVAVRADPPADATAGDPVELWTDRPDGVDSRRLAATGTLRATDETTATIAIDLADASAFDPAGNGSTASGPEYRLVTRPEMPTAVPELLAALETAPETVVRARVESGSDLENEFVDWVPGRVLLVERGHEDGGSGTELVPFPATDHTLSAGDALYALGTPAELEPLFATGAGSVDDSAEE
ncbi:hypothetical protein CHINAEXTREME_02975 [Halobiforma lacisalsi AJ5]|uniref:RCK C-terminal domain-containing protein n=1 Tax=Natronobacterium lacisalsi AJ5 TaxID=358396 RepID=M0LPN6_NATLA|nr:hypothetical protein [Halobiforma lacisalsi]APW96795.1 hypothetical protein CHINAEXTREME_02975 [Halobiforma lacisalsi AJ5]EMA35068.1 hypothetical protein C445_06215 [Halobiforma lacisalsi AJ5]